MVHVMELGKGTRSFSKGGGGNKEDSRLDTSSSRQKDAVEVSLPYPFPPFYWLKLALTGLGTPGDPLFGSVAPVGYLIPRHG